MRRLVAKSREDAYKSLRDYQSIVGKISARFSMLNLVRDPHPKWLEIILDAEGDFKTGDLVALGGYLSSSRPSTLKISITQGNQSVIEERIVKVDDNWNRFGISGVCQSTNKLKVLIKLNSDIELDVWGLACGKPHLPTQDGKEISIESISATHICPETFYLVHDAAVGLDIDDSNMSVKISEGREITLKKCSYCGRQLPIDPQRPGVLAFHKHNAKISGHQNECRACKKWRINDQFNPIRTPDQLHESSVITRERRILLREPERLQAIKERSGKGLRSIVWERFSKKCFRCHFDVKLDEFQLDHTRPLAYLWPIDEFATCLCARCNNEKKEKFPIDFYTSKELDRLSSITGLDRKELNKKELNAVELSRFLENLEDFAKRWDAKTFFAICRKVSELRPDIKIVDLLQAINSVEYERLLKEHSTRSQSEEDI